MMETAFQEIRKQGTEQFDALPWPTKTDEEWRRTDPARIGLKEEDGRAASVNAFEVGIEPVPPPMIQAGVILTDLKTAVKQFPELVAAYLFQTGTPEGLKKFVALHEARWSNGLFCYVPEGVRVEIPLHAGIKDIQGKGALFPHTLIVVGAHADATLVDERQCSSQEEITSDEMIEIIVKEGASLRYLHLQEWSSSVTELVTQRTLVERDAQFLNILVGFGGKLTKANIETVLTGENAHAELLGIIFGIETQHFDIHTLQDHKARRTHSDLLYKTALKNQAKSIYTGLIRIEKEAQKSDAYQANRNLLLDQGATADSIPMLEIHADDVRCTHGVATGPMDPDQIFYLMSRGIPPKEAEQLIVEGFFEQIFQKIPLENLREELRNKVLMRLNS